MKVSLNWVKQYTDVDISTKELVKLATERLGGVEGYDELGKHYDGIVVAKVVSCEKHPNADKLHLCKIDDGGAVKDVERDEDGFVQVVCGAPNVREGLLVAWIPPGAIVPASYGEKELFTLEARDLRGQLSNGMLASPRELGMNDDHEGILEIEEGVKPGTEFKKLFELDDIILEIENKMFTHRPDCFGQLGVAREIAGIQGKTFKSPEWYSSKIEDRGSKIEDAQNLKISIETENCPRYLAVELDNVKIKPSPLWLQSYLKRAGVRPINNVVDITNYFVLLTAQPLHAFDAEKIKKDDGPIEIIVRKPHDNEKMKLLDGKEIEPHKDAVLICDHEKPIALGGVMGGANSEVDENTTRIILECATFDMYNIRKTSMIHGIFTDAVTRFTKGQPEAQLEPVILKAIEMFKELAEAKMVGEIVDSGASETSNQQSANREIEIEAKFINERLGSKFSDDEIIQTLKNVEFDAHRASGPIAVTPPFWRTDIEIKEDIVEEIGRLHGFNQLPISLPTRSIKPVASEPERALKSQIRRILARAGANEVLTYSFVHGDLLKKVGQDPKNSYAIRNALSPDLQYYRQTLMPSLLENVHGNIKAGYDEFSLFELGKSHNKIHGEEEGLPGEIKMLALTYASKNSKTTGYFMAKKQLEYLLSQFGFTLSYQKLEDDPGYPVTSPFDHARSALVTIKETETFLGIVGEYKQSVKKVLKLPNCCAGFEIGIDHLIEAVEEYDHENYQPLSRYPSTEQDITLQVKSDLPFAEVSNLLQSELEKSDFQFELTPLGVYQKDQKSETKNLSFRITLSHHERTLTTNEVNKLVENLSWQAHETFGAEQV